MASELYVETLKGLTSGANANKVIIPSGQTLDASAGSLELPAGVGGKVLQMVHDTRVGTSATTSTSFVPQGMQVTLTPASTSSKIFITINNMADANNDACIWTIYRSIGGGSDVNLFTAGGGNEGLNAVQSTQRYSAGTCAVDSPNTTSSVTYKLYYRAGAGNTIEFPPYGSMTQFMVAMEIAG